MRNVFAAALLAVYASAEAVLDEDVFAREARELEDESLIEEGRELRHYYDKSKTFMNGRNRKYGLSSSRWYSLTNSLQVNNLGETQPAASAYSSLIADPAFSTPDALTQKGSETLFKLGEQVSSGWADNTSWVDFSSLDSTQVYTFATDIDPKKDSLTSYLLGAFGGSNDFPVPALSTVDANASTPSLATDLLTTPSNCARCSEIINQIKADADTLALNDRITKFLEDCGYFPRLRVLLGDDTADAAALYLAAGEINAARQNGTLKLTLTDEELRYNDVAVNAGNYTMLAAAKDTSNLATWELQQLFIEVSRILRSDLAVADATILNKYFPAAATATDLPKLLTAQGSNTLIKALLGVFNNLYLPTPPPGASFWIDFYECQWNCYWYDRYKVEVVYCPDARDLDGSCTLIDYNRWVQDWRGGARAYDFERWLQKGLNYQAYANGFASQDATTVCSTALTSPAKLNSTERFYRDLLQNSGFNAYSFFPSDGSSRFDLSGSPFWIGGGF